MSRCALSTVRISAKYELTQTDSYGRVGCCCAVKCGSAEPASPRGWRATGICYAFAHVLVEPSVPVREDVAPGASLSNPQASERWGRD